MLVLSRGKGESVEIEFNGVSVTVRMLKVRGNRARLGFIAPPGVRIRRTELEKVAEVVK